MLVMASTRETRITSYRSHPGNSYCIGGIDDVLPLREAACAGYRDMINSCSLLYAYAQYVRLCWIEAVMSMWT
jgi:hypothetical protein